MPNTFDGDPYASQVSSEVAWKGRIALKRVHGLNERCLEVLTQLAHRDRLELALPTVHQQRSLWRSLDATARARAARTPFLLVDVHFADAPWWREAQQIGPRRRRQTAVSPAFKGKIAGELMRETLMLAWSTVASDRASAGVLLGMTAAVSTIIDELGPHDVERIAGLYSHHLRPRWEDFPAFWSKLLRAACAGDEDVLHEIHLHGVQLMGGDLLSSLAGG